MPTRTPTPCTYPRCAALVQGSSRCAAHRGVEKREADQQRGTSAQRGYGSRWQKARLGWLKRHPLCVECESQGRVTPATVVDHIDPHKGDMRKFWDRNNWRSLCALHHNRATVLHDGGFGNPIKPKPPRTHQERTPA